MRPSPRPALNTCQSCLNKTTAELCSLDGPAAAEFEQLRHTVVYKGGQYVFYEGHAVLGLYVLCTGRLLKARAPRGRKPAASRRSNRDLELQDFTRHFWSHIQHEERVVYVLARGRLNREERKHIALKMLTA